MREIKKCFWDNCIWTGIVKLSLLGTGNFQSAANLLTSSPKIFHLNKTDFFQLNWLGSAQWQWKRQFVEDMNRAWARLPCCFSKDPQKQNFLDIYLTTFSESVISEIQKLEGSSFSSRRSKFLQDLKNAAKNCGKVFRFWGNSIWIGIVNLRLFRRGHFSSVLDVLTSSPKIFHVNKIDSFQLNWYGSDQLIW